MKEAVKIFLALPVLYENENLPDLINCLREQQQVDFELVACVNQYEEWWNDPAKKPQCEDNYKSIQFLKSVSDIKIHLIDKSSKGKGWPQKRGGVGWARKVAMDYIVGIAHDQDLIISIDADTFYPPDYLSAVQQALTKTPEAFGIAIPYYHPITGKLLNDRLILRYEIYMRYYLLNLMKINNPYAFSALGSAMASPVWAYRKAGGLTPVKSGEDFYFIQKLIKNGTVINWCETVAYPSSRFSDRVIFGTGPALIKGSLGDWDSYPIYLNQSFEKVRTTFGIFPMLYEKNIETPMDLFLKKQFKTDDLWNSFRKNYKDKSNFVRACVNKVDGLRILQFLRFEQINNVKARNEEILSDYFINIEKEAFKMIDQNKIKSIDFENSDILFLNEIRNALFEHENYLRKKFLSKQSDKL